MDRWHDYAWCWADLHHYGKDQFFLMYKNYSSCNKLFDIVIKYDINIYFMLGLGGFRV
jgi:hypothetical protein